MSGEVINKNEVDLAGSENLCKDAVLGFEFDLKRKSAFSIQLEEVETEATTLIVRKGNEEVDLVVRWLDDAAIAEACQRALERVRRFHPSVQTPDQFWGFLETQIREVFQQRLSQSRVFPARKNFIKIGLRAYRWRGIDAPIEFCVEARVHHRSMVDWDEAPFWEHSFQDNYLAAKKVFCILCCFCEAANKPRIRHVKNFARLIVEQQNI